MNEDVPFQMIAAPEGAVAVIADEVLLHFGKRTIPVLIHHDILGDIKKKVITRKETCPEGRVVRVNFIHVELGLKNLPSDLEKSLTYIKK